MLFILLVSSTVLARGPSGNIVHSLAEFEEVEVGTDWVQKGDEWCEPTGEWLNHGGDLVKDLKGVKSVNACLNICKSTADCNVCVFQKSNGLCQMFDHVPTLKKMPSGFIGRRVTVAKLCDETCQNPEHCPPDEPDKGDEGEACEQDSDCKDALFCNSAKECATKGSCVGVDDCEEGQLCKDSLCVDKGDEGDACEEDPECKDALFCNSAKECATKGSCASVDDCGEGQLCKESLCVDKGDEGDACEQDPDCKDQLFCNSARECATKGSCVSVDDCGEEQLCKDSLCVDKGDEGDDCEQDSECKDGLFCNAANECMTKGGCVSLDDCGEGQLCKNSLCVDKGDEGDYCEGDFDCKDSFFCNSANECAVIGTCITISDCGEGELCTNNICVVDDRYCKNGWATGGHCDIHQSASNGGCINCVNGYRKAGGKHWCCTSADLAKYDDCACQCITNGQIGQCECVHGGRTQGKCKTKHRGHSDSCDQCAHGFRYAWPNHFCCHDTDYSKGDCKCVDSYVKFYGEAEAFAFGESAVGVEDYAVWALAVVGLGATVYAATSALHRIKRAEYQSLV